VQNCNVRKGGYRFTIFWGMRLFPTHNFGIIWPQIDSTTTLLLKVFIWKNFVADVSVQSPDFFNKLLNLHFWAPFAGLRGNACPSAWARWEAHSQLPISCNWTCFASCYGCSTMGGLFWSKRHCCYILPVQQPPDGAAAKVLLGQWLVIGKAVAYWAKWLIRYLIIINSLIYVIYQNHRQVCNAV